MRHPLFTFLSPLPLLVALSTVLRAEPAAPFTQDADIWQRAWSAEVRESIQEHGGRFNSLIVLAGEIAWKNETPEMVRVPVQWEALRNSSSKTGVALRIGVYHGPFSSSDGPGKFIIETARSLTADAAAHHVALAEFHIDFDCAESKLGGYRTWLEAVREGIRPIPLTITTLPVWLKHAEFKPLVEATDGFVLQVHSLERPRNASTPFALCDPVIARQAVMEAARLRVPFRVALPTYGYTLGFDAAGRFIGLSAEGPSPAWAKGTVKREVRADPETMSQLVRDWLNARPASMQGIVWYRLPVAGDRLNWSWPTLESVMRGLPPKPALSVAASHPRTGLTEIQLQNSGSGDYMGPVRIEARWMNSALMASDGWNTFERTNASATNLFFQFPDARLNAGSSLAVGWLRLDPAAEVSVELKP